MCVKSETFTLNKSTFHPFQSFSSLFGLGLTSWALLPCPSWSSPSSSFAVSSSIRTGGKAPGQSILSVWGSKSKFPNSNMNEFRLPKKPWPWKHQFAIGDKKSNGPACLGFLSLWGLIFQTHNTICQRLLSYLFSFDGLKELLFMFPNGFRIDAIVSWGSISPIPWVVSNINNSILTFISNIESWN